MKLSSMYALLLCAFLALGSVKCVPAQELSQGASAQPSPGSISGSVVDATGAAIAGAHVTFTRDAQSQEIISDAAGRFSFPNISPGPFTLASSASGFATQTYSDNLLAGEIKTVPAITLPVAATTTEVTAAESVAEIAQEQIKEQEKQRVLGFIPNFYVTYISDAAPLNTKQKFELAWKTAVDPVSLMIVAGVAGFQQSQNNFPGYGQGVAGYGKRVGASYGDFLSGTFFGAAVFPALFKQDPRYFYKGTGSKRSRIFYALGSSVICKGDNGRWQTNYSNILGNLAAGGLSNLYYPAQDRNGVRLTLANSLIGIGATGGANLFEEFIVRKFTPRNKSEK